MALVNAGFNGTVEEADFAHMFAIGGADGVESPAAWAVTQGTGRQVSVAANAGRAFARGVVSRDNAGPLLANLGTPVNGQWYLIVRRINWSTNTVTIQALPSTTTSTTLPSAPPATALPIGGQEVTPGVLYDQPLAWAWVRSTDTTVVIFDLRMLPVGLRLASTESRATSLEGRATDLEGRPRYARALAGAASTNASGDVVITHGLGATPAVVMITGAGGGAIPERRTYAVIAITATTFTVRVYRQDTGAVLASNPVQFYWLAST